MVSVSLILSLSCIISFDPFPCPSTSYLLLLFHVSRDSCCKFYMKIIVKATLRDILRKYPNCWHSRCTVTYKIFYVFSLSKPRHFSACRNAVAAGLIYSSSGNFLCLKGQNANLLLFVKVKVLEKNQCSNALQSWG